MSVWDNIKLPKVLFETQSKYNGDVQVWQQGETLKLVSNGTVQSVNWDSPSAERMVFGRIVEVLKEQEPKLKKLLMFGLAGGTMQHLIATAFPGIEITSVEIDQQMVDIAKKYFRLDEIPNHHVIVDDACRVVVEPDKFDLKPNSFEAAVVDIYCGDTYPDLGDSGNFLASLKKLIVPGGLVVFNRIYLQAHQDDVNHFMDDLREFFHDLDTVTIAGKTNSDNILIYGRA